MKRSRTQKEDITLAMQMLCHSVDGATDSNDVWFYAYENLRDTAISEDEDRRLPEDIHLAEQYKGCDIDEAYDYFVELWDFVVSQRRNILKTIQVGLQHGEESPLHPNLSIGIYELGRSIECNKQ